MRPYAAVFLVLALQASILSPQISHADDAGTALCSSIFGAEASAMMAAFNAQKLTSLEACKAYEFLLERNGSGTRGVPGCYRNGNQKDRILKLNPGFAVGLYRSLSEIEKLYGGKNIIQSGYRCSPGNHSKGCAVDIIWRSCQVNTMGFKDPWRCSSDDYLPQTNSWMTREQQWIDANGKKEPYSIHLRIRGKPEGHHVEPVNTQGCVTGATVGSGNASPSAGFADAIRQALMPSQPQLPPQPPLPMQPLPMQQSPLGAFMQPVAVTTPTAGTDVVIGGVSDQLGGDSKSTGTSSADALEKLAFGDKATSTVSATSVPLIIDGKDVSGLRSQTNPDVSSASSSGSGSIAQNTFATNDLAWQATNSFSASQNSFVRILASIRATLLQMLQRLRPFGGTTTSIESEYDY